MAPLQKGCRASRVVSSRDVSSRVVSSCVAVGIILLALFDTGAAELMCVSCAAGFFLDQHALVCRRCPANSSTSESSNASLATDCVCGPGFANGTERCEPCLAGQYKEELANASCVGCMPHATTLQSASANADQCVCLPGFTVASPADSAVNEECVMCGPGSYKSLAGDGECSVCPAQHYCRAGSVVPEACPTHSVSADGAGSVYDCACEAGYYHNYTHSDPPRLECVPCPAGTYTDTLNTTTCALCPLDTFFNRTVGVSATDCFQCPEHASAQNGSTDITNCLCDLGYAGEPGQTCTPCEPEFFREDAEQYICEACPANTYNALHASPSQQDCQACPADQRSNTGSGRQLDCVCKNGTFATLSSGKLYWECTPLYRRHVSRGHQRLILRRLCPWD